MQIPRHWRMQTMRYRLQGVRYANGEVSLQARRNPPSQEARSPDQDLKNPSKKSTTEAPILQLVKPSVA